MLLLIYCYFANFYSIFIQFLLIYFICRFNIKYHSGKRNKLAENICFEITGTPSPFSPYPLAL
jgi:hypothetical protein